MKLEKENIDYANTGSRLTALDLTRLFAMLMMIQGHTLFALANPATIDLSQPVWQFWHFMRGITAPTFLFVSGIVHIFANKRQESGTLSKDTIKKRIKTALIVIGIGYLLVFPASKIYDLLYLSENSWRIFFQVNVLQMFGVSLLMLLLLYTVTRTEKQLGILSLLVASAIVIASPFVHSISWFDYVPEVVGAFLTTEHGSIFPLFPFTAYLFLGAAFGTWLKSMKAENRTGFLLKYAWMIGLPLVLIGYPLMKYLSGLDYVILDTMRVNPGLFIVRAGAVLVIISLMTLLYKMTKGMSYYYSLFGKKAIYIYVIHLLLIYGNPIFPGFYKFYRSSLSLEWSLFFAGLVISVTLLITYIIDRSTNKYEKAQVAFKYFLTAYLIYIFFI